MNVKICTHCGEPITDNSYVIGESETYKLFVVPEKHNALRLGFLFHKEKEECFKASKLLKSEQH